MPERTYKHIDIARSPTSVSGVEQVLRGDSSRMSPTYSSNCSSPCSPMRLQDAEEDPSLYQKKSVLTKVKQKARKLCSSLSKRRMEDENVTPSWGVRLEDEEEEEEEDPEYLGAPMYESELAPEAYKENARQHPRANPVISEKHVLQNNVKLGMQGIQQDLENPCSAVSPKLMSTPQPDATATPTTTTTASPNNASETLAEKLIPVYAGGSLAANSVSSKIHDVVSKHPLTSNSMHSQNSSSRLQNSLSSSASQSRRNTSQNGPSVGDYLMSKSENGVDTKTVSPMQDLSSSSASLSGKNTQKSLSFKHNSMNRSEQGNQTRTGTALQKSSSLSAASVSGKSTSQKSASAKDYSMSKSESRDDEKTASQVTSGGRAPSRTSSNTGMMDKVRGAVNSLLGNEESSQEYGVKVPTTRTSSQTQQVGHEDEKRGRILQAN